MTSFTRRRLCFPLHHVREREGDLINKAPVRVLLLDDVHAELLADPVLRIVAMRCCDGLVVRLVERDLLSGVTPEDRATIELENAGHSA
jgi:hypothetical protein